MSDKYDKFGIDKESYEKSKDILSTFELGKVEIGDSVNLQFLANEPNEIEVKNAYRKKGEPEMIKAKAMPVFIISKSRTLDSGEKVDVEIGEKMTLWLSSKSLTYQIVKVLDANENKLSGVKVKVTVGTADYKEYGTNRCYTVTQLN